MEKRGIQPKNHHKDNLKYIENIAKQNREKQKQIEQAQQLKKKRFLLNKFAHVDSKVKISNVETNSNINSSSTTHRSKSNEINHILQNKKNLHSMSNKVHNNCCTSTSQFQRTKHKQNVPTKEELIKIDQMIKQNHELKKQTDYISLNRQSAIDSKPKVTQNKEIFYVNKENYGKTPDYIIQRRIELAEKRKKELRCIYTCLIQN